MKKNLAIYIDESGNFDYSKQGSKFYVLSLVIIDASTDINEMFSKVKCKKFHAAPIIRGKDEFEGLDAVTRRRFFRSMTILANVSSYQYKTFLYTKSSFKDKESLLKTLTKEIYSFFMDENNDFVSYDSVTLYYDDGQEEITATLSVLINAIFSNAILVNVLNKNRVFELADYISEVALLEHKMTSGLLNNSEKGFFTTKEIRNNLIKPLKKNKFIK